MRILVVPITLVALATACGGGDERRALPEGAEPVELDPADFTTEIDDPYWRCGREAGGSTARAASV